MAATSRDSIIDEIDETLDTIHAYVENRGAGPQATLAVVDQLLGDAEDLAVLANEAQGMPVPGWGQLDRYQLLRVIDRCYKRAATLQIRYRELQRERDEARQWARRLYRAVTRLITLLIRTR